MNETLKIGDSVWVERRPDDIFANSFVGTIRSFRGHNVVVEDQDGDFWECAPEQLTIES